MASGRALLIVNPLRGRMVGTHLAKMEAVLAKHGLRYDVRFTEHRGHALELARRAVSEGYETIAAVGGDGTVNEVVNAAVGSSTAVAALPLGAGNDFLRSLGIWTWEEACLALAAGDIKAIDAGLADYQDEAGERRQRYYAVLADVGFGSEVVRNTPRRFRHALGGGLGYVISLYRTAVQGQARACRMKVWADGQLSCDERLLLVEALNGTYAGGGLRVAPRAKLDDTLLDVFLVRDMPWPKIWALFPKIYRGTHIEHERAEYFQVRELAVDADQAVRISVDGEVVGHTPATFKVVPGALKVRYPRREGSWG
ncbi:MAG TPA: diacylglycerol kinase family protein [Anaerolineae bacterium]|nr:diacylglycerol kinase family protein [Anaerolineae bacterium]